MRLLESLEGLAPEEAETRPQGLAPVVWQIGHAAVSNARIMRSAGMDVHIPEGWEALFAKGSDGSGPFPPLDQVVAWFREVLGQFLELASSPEKYSMPIEGSAWSNVGEALMWMHNHHGYHAGKIATLRALLGRPPQR